MIDLFDLVSPRVYVVSEKHYDEILKKRRDEEHERLEARKRYHLELVEKLDKELESLK
jgi:hypothetical protein